MEEFISDEDFLREFEDIELATDFVHAVSKLIERDNWRKLFFWTVSYRVLPHLFHLIYICTVGNVEDLDKRYPSLDQVDLFFLIAIHL